MNPTNKEMARLIGAFVGAQKAHEKGDGRALESALTNLFEEAGKFASAPSKARPKGMRCISDHHAGNRRVSYSKATYACRTNSSGPPEEGICDVCWGDE